ncbi:MAG TPA: hypothetical protein VHA05_01575 [Candidatus Saccharimonadales bacterium]|nr:hypothetical protein [Candidatus Saccharimonadales bacterium]
MSVLLVGNGGREAAIADRLAAEGEAVHVAAQFRNPSLTHAAERSEGQFYQVDSITDPRLIAEVAVASRADLAWVNQDDALANGVIDAIRQHAPAMAVASPTREGSRIEWDKFYGREIMSEIDYEWDTDYTPRHVLASDADTAIQAIDYFEKEGTGVVVKPRGLTGGKLVKVMGPHLRDYAAAVNYALSLIRTSKYGDGVSIEERLEGHEFTVQALTDGQTLIMPPETYDYPYREAGDKGPGTGGMGDFAFPEGSNLPFLNDSDRAETQRIMGRVLEKLQERGQDFKGVLYGSFFKTDRGIKVVEFNARIGDPEGITMMELLDTPLIDILHKIARQELEPDDVRFRRMASAAIYLVSPSYAYPGREGGPYCFEVDQSEVTRHLCNVYFAAAENIGGDSDSYHTVGNSRTVALAANAPTPWEARGRIIRAIRDGVRGKLEFRNDIADEGYIRRLAQNR